MNTLTCGYVPDMVCKSVAESCIFAGERDRVRVAKAIVGSCIFAGRREGWNRNSPETPDAVGHRRGSSGPGCAESLRGAQTGAPCKLRQNGERPRSAGGVQEFECVVRGTFRSFSRSIGGKSSLYRRRKMNTFRKGAFRTAMTSPNVGNDIGRPVGAEAQ